MKEKDKNQIEGTSTAKAEEPKDHQTPEEIEAFMQKLEKSVEKLRKNPGVIDAYVEKE